MTSHKDFFKAKQPWSRIKDQLLGSYLVPYLSKTIASKRPVVLVDCFAGPGRYESGDLGSPVLISRLIEERGYGATCKLLCIEKVFYQSLHDVLQGYHFAEPHEGDYEFVLPQLLNQHNNRAEHLLLYVDPYGIQSLKYDIFRLLQAMAFRSTELILNLNTFGFLREGCRLLKGVDIREQEEVFDAPDYVSDVDNAGILDDIAGGVYWRTIVLDYYAEKYAFNKAEELFAAAYCLNLKSLFGYTLSMPIKAKLSHMPKYRIIYATNHPHGLILMADNMNKRWAEFKEHSRSGQQFFFDLDYPDTLVDTSQDALRTSICRLPKNGMELAELYAQLIDQFGILYSSSDYSKVISELDGGIITRQWGPPVTPNGRPRRGMDYKSRDYKVYVTPKVEAQPNLF